jgi:spermidine synthase
MTHRQAAVFLFLEGFASIAIQFLVLRQLTPFVGSSIIITSLVISAFLASLALGYRKGGRIRENHAEILARNLFKAAVVIGLFVSYSFISLYFEQTSFLGGIISTSLYLFVFMVPAVYWVAQTIPLLVNFVVAGTSSQKAGDALLFSTLGNVVGGIITTVIIMYYLGVSWALFITCGTLLLLAFYVSSLKNYALALTISSFFCIYQINISMDDQHFVASNSYANYQVAQTADHIYFFSNNSAASSYHKHNGKGFQYIEDIKKAILTYGKNQPEEQVLVIGAGGFSLTADDTIQSSVHYVDIDSQIKAVAEQFFLNGPVNAEFTGADARYFLQQNQKKFDFIIVDAYTNKSAIPWSLTTKQFYRQVKENLKENGFMLSNVLANAFKADKFSRRIDNTIKSVFNTCFVNVTLLSKQVANNLYVCTNSFAEHDSTLIYSDHDNKSIVDYFSR